MSVQMVKHCLGFFLLQLQFLRRSSRESCFLLHHCKVMKRRFTSSNCDAHNIQVSRHSDCVRWCQRQSWMKSKGLITSIDYWLELQASRGSADVTWAAVDLCFGGKQLQESSAGDEQVGAQFGLQLLLLPKKKCLLFQQILSRVYKAF